MKYTEFIAKNRKLLPFIVLAVCAVVIFHRLADSPLGGDDCYYAEVSKEMSMYGDYLTPRNGHLIDFHTSKPPVLFWMNALSGNLLGFDTFAMRLPSAILGFLCVAGVFFFAWRYFGLATAVLAAIILTFTQQYLYHVRSSVTDGPFAVFFAFSMMGFWVARAEKMNAFYYLSGLFLGLAVMTRQIPGLFIIPPILVYLALKKDISPLKNTHLWGGLLLAAAVIAPWHLIMYEKYGASFVDQYTRVALKTAVHGYPLSEYANPSLNPWYAYFEIILSNYEPWLILLLAGVFFFFKRLKNMPFEKRDILIFLMSYAFVTILLFQLARVKQYHYIVPVYVPFAVISAWAVENFGERLKTAVTLTVCFSACLLAAVYIAYPVIPKTLDSREFSDTIKLVPELKKLSFEAQVLAKGFSHYNNCFWFYADRKAVRNTEEELARKIGSGKKYYFVLFKDAFERIIRKTGPEKISIIKTTDDSVLFKNY
ncbi:MAG: glycosyltransferase family 39 protein [Endomicrobiales bacterium]|nr:glycosyltransferase family 39 protein [Endomicrobiales bacterium]